MSTNVTFNGTSFTIPAIADASWGGNVSAYLIAIATGCLQKTGGTFTLSAEVNFGATYGLKTAYLKTQTANIAAAGYARLAKTDTISWRNNANSADLALGIDGSDNFTFGGTKIPLSGLIVNADVASGAAIAYAKLALTGSILNADLAGSIAYAKLVLTGSVLNADLAGSIAYSKLVLAGSVVNADISSSAAIAYSKLALAGSIAISDIASAAKSGTGTTLATTIAPSISGLVSSDFHDFAEIVTPATPSAGVLRIYSKSDDNLYAKTPGGIEKQIGAASSGSGQKNYIGASTSNTAAGWLLTNAGTTGASIATLSTDLTAADLPRANTTKSAVKALPVAVSSSVNAGTFTATNATPTVLTFANTGMQSGYVVYVANSGGALPTGLAASTPYWCTMQSATTAKISTSYANYLAGVFVAASSTGTGTQYYGWQGFVIPWTLDAADYNVKLQAQWAQNVLSGAAGDWQVDILYNSSSSYTYNTYTRAPLSTDSASTTVLPNLEGTFRTAFDAPGSSGQYMEIRFQNIAATTHALVLSDVIVGPGTMVQGAAVGPRTSWTPTFTGLGTATHVDFSYTRIGQLMYIEGQLAVGTTTSSGVNFTLPIGLTADTSLYDSNNRYVSVGNFSEGTSSATAQVLYTAVDQQNTGNIYVVGVRQSNGAFNGQTPVAGTSLQESSGGIVTLTAMVPIAQWAGSGTVNVVQNDVEYLASTSGTWDAAASSAQTVYGPQGAPISGALTATRNKVCQTITPIGATTQLVLQYRVAGTNTWVNASDSQWPQVSAPAVAFGANVTSSTAANLVQVTFNQHAIQGTTFNSATGALDYSAAAYDFWRIAKYQAGVAVGFGAYVPGLSSGLVPAAGLPGNTTGNAIATGTVGEAPTKQTGTATATTTLANFASITLTAGVWVLSASASAFTGAALGTYIQLAIATSSGNSTAGCTAGYDNVYGAVNASQGSGQAVIPAKYINIAATTTYYLNGRSDHTTSTDLDYFLQAVRIS